MKFIIMIVSDRCTCMMILHPTDGIAGKYHSLKNETIIDIVCFTYGQLWSFQGGQFLLLYLKFMLNTEI